MSANIEDDDAPPDLVDVSAMPADQPDSIEEEPTARVPITLVTGMVLKNGLKIFDQALTRHLKATWGREKPPY